MKSVSYANIIIIVVASFDAICTSTKKKDEKTRNCNVDDACTKTARMQRKSKRVQMLKAEKMRDKVDLYITMPVIECRYRESDRKKE